VRLPRTPNLHKPAVTPAPDYSRNSTDGSVSGIKRALQGLALITCVAIVDLGLYVLLVFLARHEYITANSFFPSLVLFLLFALSVGIILIVGLGEKIDTTDAKNKWIRKFGVTPILVVVSVLIAITVSSRPWAPKIFSSDNVPVDLSQKFMLANLGVRCLSNSQSNQDLLQALGLLILITSDDDSYVSSVRSFLNNPEQMKYARIQKVEFVEDRDTDENYQLIDAYTKLTGKYSAIVSGAVSTDEHWVAYTVDVKDPQHDTFVPVPTMFGKQHRTHLFVITTTKSQDPVTAVASPVLPPKGTALWKKRLVPLFEVQIFPRLQPADPQVNNVSVEIFPDPGQQICWSNVLIR
jgi:hypothetical protein